MAESSFLDPARALRAAGIHEGHVVADLGCGSGFFTRAAAREVAPGLVWAIDINRDLIARVKNLSHAEGLDNVEVAHGDVGAPGGTPLPPEHFDFALLTNVLFSVEDKPAAVREVRRILKKNGRTLVIDWSASHGGLGPHPDHVITEREAKKLFEDEGFVVVSEVPAGAYHWGLVVRKKS